MDIGPTELIIIMVIVLLLFGPGRVGKIGGELGVALHEFREGLRGDNKKKNDDGEQKAQIPESEL